MFACARLSPLLLSWKIKLTAAFIAAAALSFDHLTFVHSAAGRVRVLCLTSKRFSALWKANFMVCSLIWQKVGAKQLHHAMQSLGIGFGREGEGSPAAATCWLSAHSASGMWMLIRVDSLIGFSWLQSEWKRHIPLVSSKHCDLSLKYVSFEQEEDLY